MRRAVAVAVLLVVLLAGCTAKPIPGFQDSYIVELPKGCELWLFTPQSHIHEKTIVLTCPGADLLRLYPWPPALPWGESPSDEPAPGPIEISMPGAVM